MKNILRQSLILPLICLTTILSQAAGKDNDTLTLEFPQGKAAIYPHFKGNDSTLRKIRQITEELHNPDSLAQLRHISVIGGASPEGSVAINRSLSQKRADNIFDYLSKGIQIPDSLTSFTFLGRDWEGLKELVENDPAVPYRDETLALINEIMANHPNQGENDNLLRLQTLRGGIPYRYMYSKLFPALRASTLLFEYYPSIPRINVPDFPTSLTLVPVLGEITTISDEVMTCKQCCKPFYMDLRTNMLFDALLLPNIGAEFYVGKNLSIIGNWMYGWWDKDRLHRYWRAYGSDLGLRWWFGKKAHEKPLTGHHIGIYGGVVTYDFEFGGRGYMGGRPSHNLWDRCNYLAGIEYGYSLPVARRLNIDFTIGIGYLGGKLLEYVPKDNHYVWQKTEHLSWIGPTKAEISLVWLIGCDNYNVKKGGKR